MLFFGLIVIRTNTFHTTSPVYCDNKHYIITKQFTSVMLPPMRLYFEEVLLLGYIQKWFQTFS